MRGQEVTLSDPRQEWAEDTFKAVAPRLWRALLLYSGSGDLASDAVSEAFAQAMGARQEIRDPKAWIWTAAFDTHVEGSTFGGEGITMRKSMKDRFREVDRVPSEWDEGAEDAPGIMGRSRSRRGVAGFALVAASIVAVTAVAVVLLEKDHPQQDAPDASWLLSETQASCVEQYSPRTLQSRSWALEGVIVAVNGPADPHSEDPGQTNTTVTFDVGRWFWGGSGDRPSLITSAFPSSAGAVDQSLGARLLVSGEEDFLWLCGFTQPFTDSGWAEFEAAAAARSTS